ncbi:hypothetical protein [Prevotella melaninogenica]|nr:hypothetical protein [Prevotella melaninogenica]
MNLDNDTETIHTYDKQRKRLLAMKLTLDDLCESYLNFRIHGIDSNEERS